MRATPKTVGALRRAAMARIAAMAGTPAERLRCLRQFNVAGRERSRPVFRPIDAIRALWEQVDPQKVLPTGSGFLQRLRARARKVSERQALLRANDYLAIRVRIQAIEKKVTRSST